MRFYRSHSFYTPDFMERHQRLHQAVWSSRSEVVNAILVGGIDQRIIEHKHVFKWNIIPGCLLQHTVAPSDPLVEQFVKDAEKELMDYHAEINEFVVSLASLEQNQDELKKLV
ncbi:hypothetical protein WG66_016690 [Moniliophthora roreri]|nr:hypothetical protein WG66_016690 [Moniliophthora roreri]